MTHSQAIPLAAAHGVALADLALWWCEQGDPAAVSRTDLLDYLINYGA